MTADPHTDDARNQAITLRYLAARTDRSMPGIAEHVREAAATIDALAARLEAAERDRDRQQERVDYLFRTHPSEWEPEVIRWLSPAVRAGWEGSDDAEQCEECNGRGFHVGPVCCGNLLDGDCRGDCSVPERVDCETCGGREGGSDDR